MRVPVNVPLMLFSLFISITLWFVVYARDFPEPQGMYIKVTYETLDTDHWYRSHDPDVNPNRAFLKFSGSVDQLQEISNYDTTLNVDLTKAHQGVGKYPAQLYPPFAQKLLLGGTPFIRVVLEKKESKMVPVIPTATGNWTHSEYAVDISHVVPNRVRVTGPISALSRIIECVATVDESSISPTDPQPQSLTPVPFDGRSAQNVGDELNVEPITVSVTPIITAAPQEKSVVVNAQIVGQPALGYIVRSYQVIPNTVMLKGSPSKLANTSVINTEAIDVSGLVRDRTFRVRLQLPVGLSAQQRTVTVEYHVRPDPSFHSGASVAPPAPKDTFPSTVPPLNGARRGGT